MDPVRSAIRKHPVATAAAIAILVVIVIILAFYLTHYKGMCPPKAKSLIKKDGMYGGAPAPPGNVCAPGETPVTYQNPDGSMMVYCRNTNALPGPATVCKKGWDPAASAEAEALATVGALEHDSYGEKKLQRAVDAAYDSNVGLSDEQLSAVMHEGGTP